MGLLPVLGRIGVAVAIAATLTTVVAAPASAGTESCKASYYGGGGRTASGERLNEGAMTAAHKTLKFGTRVTVTNTRNHKKVTVRINDRGPHVKGRCIDLTTGAFKQLASTSAGVIQVRIDY